VPFQGCSKPVLTGPAQEVEVANENVCIKRLLLNLELKKKKYLLGA